MSYHKHLLAEFETLAGALEQKRVEAIAKVQAIDVTGSDGTKASGGDGGKGKPLCKYFLSPKGCKYGAACRNTHSMAELTKAERFRRCLNCGSEGHRAVDCQATRSQDPNKAQEAKPTPQPVAPATPIMSIHSFLLQACQALRQSGATAQATLPVSPTPEGGGQQQSSSSQPSINRLSIASIMPASCFGSQNPASPTPPLKASNQGLGMPPNGQNQGLTDSHFGSENQGLWRGHNAGFGSKNGHICAKSTFSARELGLGPEEGFCPLVYAVLDSGATHPMRQAKDEKEWEEALEVQVALAGDNTTSMRLTSSGTLLLPFGGDGLCQPIVPMGAIIEQLGFKLVWSAGSCELYPPGGSPLRLEVENGCAEVECNMALALIAQLEACKAQRSMLHPEVQHPPHQASAIPSKRSLCPRIPNMC